MEHKTGILYKKLYNALIEEIEKERGDGNFYEPFTKSLQFKEYKSWENAYEETIANDKLNGLKEKMGIEDEKE